MARLQNPQNRIDAIRQDYRDKHNLPNSSVLIGRKYDKQKVNKNGQKVFDENVKSVASNENWYEPKRLIVNEEMYVRNSFFFSETHKNDCYCTLNGFPKEYAPVLENKKGKNKESYRAVEKLAYLTGFYLDFDHKVIHNRAKKKQQVSTELVEEVKGYEEQIVKTLEDYLAGDYGMPVISFTGGGYGFYIKIKPLEATDENMQLYMAVWEKLYQRFNVLFKDLLDVFENDHSVLDLVRVIRITGTYNSKTDTYSYFVRRYGDADTNEIYEYSLEDIVLLYHMDKIVENLSKNQKKVSHSPLQKKEEEKKEEDNTFLKDDVINRILSNSNNILDYIKKENITYVKKWYVKYVNEKQIGRYLDLSIQSLKYLDGQNSVHRNRSLFLIACFKTELEYAKCGCFIFDEVDNKAKEDVIDYIIELNKNLTTPLDAEELICLTYSALQNVYHFRKLDTIQIYLNLTDNEFDELGWNDNQKKEEQKEENNNALTELDRKVVKLYLSGLSDRKIGKELNIPKLQSIRIRKRLGVKDRIIKYEDVDFEGNKRHLKNKSNSLRTKENSEETVLKANTEAFAVESDLPTFDTSEDGIDHSEEFLAMLMDGCNANVRGKAGRGKSTLVERYVEMSKHNKKKILVVAPSGVAAQNCGGQTIHHALIMDSKIYYPKEPLNLKVVKKLQKVDIVIIDEVGCVRVDVFNYVMRLVNEAESVYNKRIQVIVAGDFNQLAPVITQDEKEWFEAVWKPYLGARYNKGCANEDPLWDEMNFVDMCLTKNFRSGRDEFFANICDGVNAKDVRVLPFINKHVDESKRVDENYIHICTTNKEKDLINQTILSKHTEAVGVLGLDFGVYIGMPLICTRNVNNAFANGTMCEVVDMAAGWIKVKNKQGQNRTFKYHISNILERHPLEPAFAMTVHKAQGQTFDKIVFHPESGCFAEKQLYVAMTRVRSGEGFVLASPIKESDVLCG